MTCDHKAKRWHTCSKLPHCATSRGCHNLKSILSNLFLLSLFFLDWNVFTTAQLIPQLCQLPTVGVQVILFCQCKSL